MENWKVKLKLNQIQPRIFDNNPASIRGFSYEADGNLDLHRSVLHTDLPAPYCFDCNQPLAKSGKKLLGIL